MLWIALYLPDLSLQSIENRLYLSGEKPGRGKVHAHVICEGPDTRPVLCAVNPAARELGLQVGQTVSMARALVQALVVSPRNPLWEEEALAKVGTIASQFTPSVSLSKECVLLEVSSSLALFGGPARLLQRLRTCLHDAGFRALTGVAPTPLAAWLFARARMTMPGTRGALDLTHLADRLADLPLALFDWPATKLTTLSQLGISRIRDMALLPRGGVSRRFGLQIITDLDRALGRIPDPRLYFSLPQRFSTRAEFMSEVESFEGLRFPIRRMLGELETFLRARGAGTTAFTLTFEHGRAHSSVLPVATQQVSRQRERWETQLVERVTRTPLAGGVSSIALSCDAIAPFQEENISWLPERKALDNKVGELTEKLTARLGDDHVFGLMLKEDHRPEHAWRQKGNPESSWRLPANPWPRRPLWLLEAPRQISECDQRPSLHGTLTILSGPERIESGWWDGNPTRRDYFIARNPRGETVWVYRDLQAQHNWFLHGYFA